MKSRSLLINILLIAALIIFTAGAARAADKVGTVVGVKGTVSVTHGGTGKAVPLSVKDAVYKSDRITTGEHSKVKLLMVDDSVLTLGQNGDMTLQDYDFNPDENRRSAVTNLSSGSLKSIISKFLSGVGSKFEVHTPTAVSGARGTVNIAAVINQTRTLVVGEEGSTEVSNIDPAVSGSQTLGGYMGSYIDKGMPPSDPFKVPADMMDNLDSDTTLTREPGFGPEDTIGAPPLNPAEPPVPETPPVNQEPKPEINKNSIG